MLLMLSLAAQSVLKALIFAIVHYLGELLF